MQQVKPAELAQMATLDISNSWGVMQAIVDVLRGFPRDEKTSKYLILKDPNKVGSHCLRAHAILFMCTVYMYSALYKKAL